MLSPITIAKTAALAEDFPSSSFFRTSSTTFVALSLFLSLPWFNSGNFFLNEKWFVILTHLLFISCLDKCSSIPLLITSDIVLAFIHNTHFLVKRFLCPRLERRRAKKLSFLGREALFSNFISLRQRKQFFTFEGNYLELLWKMLPLFVFHGNIEGL